MLPRALLSRSTDTSRRVEYVERNFGHLPLLLPLVKWRLRPPGLVRLFRTAAGLTLSFLNGSPRHPALTRTLGWRSQPQPSLACLGRPQCLALPLRFPLRILLASARPRQRRGVLRSPDPKLSNLGSGFTPFRSLPKALDRVGYPGVPHLRLIGRPPDPMGVGGSSHCRPLLPALPLNRTLRTIEPALMLKHPVPL